MSNHVNKNFLDRFLGKELSPAEKQKQEQNRSKKLTEQANQLHKFLYMEQYYRQRNAPKSFHLQKNLSSSIHETIAKYFAPTIKENANLTLPSTWIAQNTPQGTFYFNPALNQWMNNLGNVANTLDELLQSEGSDLDGGGPQFISVNPQSAEDPPLPAATSSLDYEVFATDWNIQLLSNFGYGTANYTLHSLVPGIYLNGNEYNGYRYPTDNTSSGFVLNAFKTDCDAVPPSRRVVNLHYLWDDIPALSQPKRAFYENTADATNYLGSTFLTPWCDVNVSDCTNALVGVLNQCKDENIVIPYFTDNRGWEVIGEISSLQGDHTYWDGNGQFDAAGNPTHPIKNANAAIFPNWYPDARYFAAWINDPRFNNYILPITNKSIAQRLVEYYNILSGNTANVSAEVLYSKAAGVTAFNDFTYYGAATEHPYSYYGPGPAQSLEERNDEIYKSQAWVAALDELNNGHYVLDKMIKDAKTAVPFYANTKYSSYEMYPISAEESNFYRDSNDQSTLKPPYENISGSRGFYGWHGNIIYPLGYGFPDEPVNLISGYVVNPQTDEERYNWQGHQKPNYTPSPGASLVRYAATPMVDYEQWKLEVTHKEFINDLKIVRLYFRSKPDYHNHFTPFLATNQLAAEGTWYSGQGAIPGGPYSLYNDFYDSSRYFREFVYHALLHGVLYVMNYWADKPTMHSILDTWRNISYNSKSVACSNASGDVNLPVDRLLLGDAITNVAKSGGRLTATGKYLWRITAPPSAIRQDNTIVFARVGNDSDIPATVVCDGSNVANGRGIWIKRLVSTPPNYVVVPEP